MNMERPDLIEKILPATVTINKVQDDMLLAQEKKMGDKSNVDITIRIVQGSGFVIDSDNGYIVTNYHVVDEHPNLSVTLYSPTAKNNIGKTYPVRVIGKDDKTDVAVLQIVGLAPRLPCIPMGDSDEMRVGEEVSAFGAPAALHSTVTNGIVSAVNRRSVVEKPSLKSMIQIDAAINPGNSGGALVDRKGRVVGINTIKYNATEGIAFAVDSNTIKFSINQIITNGTVKRNILGVSFTDVTGEQAKAMSLPDKVGAFVVAVHEGSPAEKAGIEKGDIILAFGNHEISDGDELIYFAGNSTASSVDVTILRNGKEMTVTAAFPKRQALPPKVAMTMQP